MTAHHLDAPDVLTDGTWQPRRGVQVWAPDDPEAFRHEQAIDPCGTDRGYQRHRKAAQPACEPCRAAHSAAAKVYRVRRETR